MPDRFLVSAVGAVIDIDVSRRDPAFQARALAAWADALYAGDGPADAVAAVRPELGDDAALAMLSTDVTLRALEVRQGDDLWMLHAAGLADENGSVVVLSAPSGTGKTTAARHLSRRYAYISDETIAIDARGTAIPYRKPLSVIERDVTHKVQVALSSLDGGRSVPEGLRVVKIVVLHRDPDGPETPELEQLDPVTALELLAPQSSYLGSARAPLHLIDALLRATGGAVRLHYREVSTIDDTIAALLRTERTPVDTVAPPRDHTAACSEAPEGTFVRAEVVDELDLGDGRLALLSGADDGAMLRVLDGIGPAIWHAAHGSTLDEIVAAVIAHHGTPEGADATQVVDAALQQLVADGVLVAPTQS